MMPTIAMIVWNEFTNDARVLNEARTLKACGYKVTVFALCKKPDAPATPWKETLPEGIKVVRVASSPLTYLLQAIKKPRTSLTQPAESSALPGVGQKSLRGLLRIASKIGVHVNLLFRMVLAKPAVVHAHDVNTLPTAWLAARLCRARIVYDAHEISTSREGYAAFRGLVAGIESRLLPRTDAVITTTRLRATFLARAWHIPRPLVLQNRPRRVKNPARTSLLRERLGLQHPWPIVLYQGGLQQGRGLHLFINAALHNEAAYFVLIGSGRLEHSLHEQIRTLELQQRVFILPTVPLQALPLYTASADIGVQPIENTCLNHYTTDSNKLFEYLQAHLPVVASGMPEIRRIVTEYETGICTPPGDGHALSHAIGMLLKDEALRMRLRENARIAAEKVCWEAQESSLKNLYVRLCPLDGRRQALPRAYVAPPQACLVSNAHPPSRQKNESATAKPPMAASSSLT